MRLFQLRLFDCLPQSEGPEHFDFTEWSWVWRPHAVQGHLCVCVCVCVLSIHMCVSTHTHTHTHRRGRAEARTQRTVRWRESGGISCSTRCTTLGATRVTTNAFNVPYVPSDIINCTCIEMWPCQDMCIATPQVGVANTTCRCCYVKMCAPPPACSPTRSLARTHAEMSAHAHKHL